MYGSLGISDSEVKSFDGSRSKKFVPPNEIACQAVNPCAGGVGVNIADADK